MRVLLLTPVEQGSGETITALHIAENLVSLGYDILFLASTFARQLIRERFPNYCVELGSDGRKNHRIWRSTLESYRPEIVLIADYPLMFFRQGCSPLASVPGWVESLNHLDLRLVSLDHFGFAQCENGLYLGPPHLGFHYQKFPAIPESMDLLLPCPMHEPGHVPGRRGTPFRYWQVPISIPDEMRQEVRQRYLENESDILLFHSVPNWAWRFAEKLNLQLYHFLPAIFDYYFGDLPGRVTIVSVNNGKLLSQPAGSRIRFINLGPVPKDRFEALLFAADLVITENKLSISMGKALCGFQPCAVFKNSYRFRELMAQLSGKLRSVVLAMERNRIGTVYPYEVYPTVVKADIDAIGLYKGNSLTEAFWEFEIFGGEETKEKIYRIFTDPAVRESLVTRQENYIRKLQKLPESGQLLGS